MYNRRSFLKKLTAAGTTLSMLNGLPLRALGGMAGNLSDQQDQILVMIQLFGGNDGLNTLVPLDQYDRYHHLRPNLALPLDGQRKVLTLNDNLALHPDMMGFRELYDQGELAIVQGVGYDNFNQSHFRSTNIWLTGSDSSEYLETGWAGRYLEHEFSDYLNSLNSSADPPGLEIGNELSLAFHTASGQPVATAVQDPIKFYSMVSGSGGNLEGQFFPANTYGKLLKTIVNLELKTGKQSERLKNVFEAGRNTVTYPEKYPYFAPTQFVKNPLSKQLQTIARLISGGSKTRVYLAKMGGFDTHKRQVEYGDPTFGSHASLLYHLSSAVKAFQDDLKQQGLSDRVVTMTFSEFGRRAEADYDGTDHGKAAPLFVIGKPVKAGVIGSNPDLNDLDGGNLRHQFDYRQVYTTILADWLKASGQALQQTRLDGFTNQKLDLFGTAATPNSSPVQANNSQLVMVKAVYPNPAKDYVHLHFRKRNSSYTTIHIFNNRGEPLAIPVNGPLDEGEHLIKVDVSKFYSGVMHYKIQSDDSKLTGSFVKGGANIR